MKREETVSPFAMNFGSLVREPVGFAAEKKEEEGGEAISLEAVEVDEVFEVT